MLGIKGARGTGKTTMLLQRIKETAGNNLDEVFYASLDNMWFQTHSAEDLVEFYIPVASPVSTSTKSINTGTGQCSSKICMTTIPTST